MTSQLRLKEENLQRRQVQLLIVVNHNLPLLRQQKMRVNFSL